MAALGAGRDRRRGGLVLLLNLGEVIATVGGLFSLDLALGVPLFVAGLVLWWFAFRAMGADLRLPRFGAKPE